MNENETSKLCVLLLLHNASCKARERAADAAGVRAEL